MTVGILSKVVGLSKGPKRSAGATAVVTGAGSGIGRAFALELAARGGEVVCADIDKDRALETVELIRARYGRPAHAFFCDVSQREDVVRMAEYAVEVFGAAPHIVVNNAGVGIGGKRVGEIGFADWEWALGINLWGVVHGCEIFAPMMRAAGRGGIVNVASAAGFAAAPMMAVYNTSKAGVLSLSETMAAELSGSGVAVTVLCPTFVKTNVVSNGRITAGPSSLADRLMNWTGFEPERVAEETLDSLDRGRLYVLPQLDARMIWQLKRTFPATYTTVTGWLNRVLPADAAPAQTVSEKTGV